MASSNTVDNVADESLPVEMAKHRGYCLLVAEVTQCLVDVVDEAVSNSFAAAISEGNRDIRDAKSNAVAGGSVLVQEAGCCIGIVDGVCIRDSEGLREELVRFIALLNRVSVLSG